MVLNIAFATYVTAVAGVLAAAVAVAMLLFVWVRLLERSRSRVRRLPRHLLRDRADAIDDAYRETKRAMNDVAGQSWRNIVE